MFSRAQNVQHFLGVRWSGLNALIPPGSALHLGNLYTINDRGEIAGLGADSRTFTPAGNMEIERAEHAATLLLNGEVLITGGINADNAEYLNSLGLAELFP